MEWMQSTKTPKEFAEELITEAHQYNGFNLIVADISSKSMLYVSNRPQGEPVSVQEVSPGIHVLSNAKLDSPWHKVRICTLLIIEIRFNIMKRETPRKERVKSWLVRIEGFFIGWR